MISPNSSAVVGEGLCAGRRATGLENTTKASTGRAEVAETERFDHGVFTS